MKKHEDCIPVKWHQVKFPPKKKESDTIIDGKGDQVGISCANNAESFNKNDI